MAKTATTKKAQVEEQVPVQMEEQVVTQVEEQVEHDVSTTHTIANGSTPEQIIKFVLATGGSKTTAIVKNVNVRNDGEVTRIILTLDKPIKAYVMDETGSYEETEVMTLNTSVYEISAVIKNTSDAWIGNKIVDNPDFLNILLSRAKINILSREVIAGEPVINLFSTNPNQIERFYDHNLYIHNIIDIEFGNNAKVVINKAMDSIADKLANSLADSLV